jgi:hypothetical protein
MQREQRAEHISCANLEYLLGAVCRYPSAAVVGAIDLGSVGAALHDDNCGSLPAQEPRRSLGAVVGTTQRAGL